MRSAVIAPPWVVVGGFGAPPNSVAEGVGSVVTLAWLCMRVACARRSGARLRVSLNIVAVVSFSVPCSRSLFAVWWVSNHIMLPSSQSASGWRLWSAGKCARINGFYRQSLPVDRSRADPGTPCLIDCTILNGVVTSIPGRRVSVDRLLLGWF